MVDRLRNAAASATVINGEAGLEHSAGPERSAARFCARPCGPSLQFGQEVHAGISPVRDVSSVFDRHGLAMRGSLTQGKANTDPETVRRTWEVSGSRLDVVVVLALQFARAEKSEASRRAYRSDFELFSRWRSRPKHQKRTCCGKCRANSTREMKFLVVLSSEATISLRLARDTASPKSPGPVKRKGAA